MWLNALSRNFGSLIV